jgi:hypothetical protein
MRALRLCLACGAGTVMLSNVLVLAGALRLQAVREKVKFYASYRKLECAVADVCALNADKGRSKANVSGT